MGFYNNLAATALRLITDKGTSITISRLTGGTFDPVSGTFTVAPSETSGTVKAIVTRYTTQGVKKLLSGNIAADNGVMKALIEGRLRKVLIAAGGAPFEPKFGDTITGLSSASWSVLGCNPVNTNDSTPVLYEVACVAK